jgi:hypothetical protein
VLTIVSILVLDIAEADDVQLLLSTMARGIDREENRPGDATANKADYGRNLQEAEEEVAVKRVVLQDIGIRKL